MQNFDSLFFELTAVVVFPPSKIRGLHNLSQGLPRRNAELFPFCQQQQGIRIVRASYLSIAYSIFCPSAVVPNSSMAIGS